MTIKILPGKLRPSSGCRLGSPGTCDYRALNLDPVFPTTHLSLRPNGFAQQERAPSRPPGRGGRLGNLCCRNGQALLLEAAVLAQGWARVCCQASVLGREGGW